MTHPKYTILALVSGSETAHEYKTANTLLAARRIAREMAKEYMPKGVKSRPVWCGAQSWHEHPDAECMTPVGGYDCGDEGSAAVIFAREN